MASTVSDTDLRLFMGLANQDKINEEPRKDDDVEDVEDDEEDEEEEGEEDDEDEEDEEDEDEPPHRMTEAPRSVVSSVRAPREAPPPPPMTSEETAHAKTAVLLELERLRGLGCRLTREYTMDSSLEEMEYEARRHVLMQEERNMVSTMKDGLRLFTGGMEFANTKFGPFLNLTGFSQVVSTDLTAGKYNLVLMKLSRKYFSTPGVSSSPEAEIAFALLSSAASHHFQRTYMQKMMPQAPARASVIPPAADDDSDDDEGLPPAFQA